MQPQKRKIILGFNDYIFCHSHQTPIFKFVVHFNNSENRLPWYIRRTALESVSTEVCRHLCESAVSSAVPQHRLQLNRVQR